MGRKIREKIVTCNSCKDKLLNPPAYSKIKFTHTLKVFSHQTDRINFGRYKFQQQQPQQQQDKDLEE